MHPTVQKLLADCLREKGRFVLLLSLAAMLMLLSVAFPAEAAFSVSIAPVELTLKPGESFTGFALATNNGEETEQVKVYLGDWQPVENGTKYLEPGVHPRGLAHWMKISRSRVTLDAGGAEKVFYEISIPENSELSGSYWGMLFLEDVPPEAERLEPGEEVPQMAIRTVTRYALKFYVNIEGTEESKATFASSSLEATEEGLVVGALFENLGNVWQRPEVWLEVHSANGEVVYRAEHRLKTVLPGDEFQYRFPLKDAGLEKGSYFALIIADYQAPKLIAAQCEIDIGD